MWEKPSDIPADVRKRFENALACRDGNQADEACSILSALIDEYPEWSPPYSIRGGILFDLRRFSEAEECYRRAVSLKPKSEISSLGLFHSLWEKSKRQDAMEEMRRFTAEGGVSRDYEEILKEVRAKADSTPLK